MDWTKTIISSSTSIKKALKNLDESSAQITFAVDKKRKLLGSLTDGDVRRHLLSGGALEDNVSLALNKNTVTVNQNMSTKSALRLMEKHKIKQIPIVDTKNQIIGLHLREELLSKPRFKNNFVIMAGGRGTRLLPHTATTPKPLLPIAGKPLIQHIIERAHHLGFENFVISTGYLRQKITDYLGDGSELGVNISYLNEKEPLGTAGSLSLIENLKHPIICSNCDVLTELDYVKLLNYHHQNFGLATMAIRKHELQNPFGVVEIEGNCLSGFEEKPVYKSYVNTGVYVLSAEAVKYVKKNEKLDMPDLLMRIIDASGTVAVYPLHEPWLDVGSHDDIEKAENLL